MYALLNQANAQLFNASRENTEAWRITGMIVLFGLALSAVFLPHVADDQLGWIFTHLE